MVKDFLYGVYTFSLKKGVDFVLSKTTVDEKIQGAAKEAKSRAKNVMAELKDVKSAISEVIDQAEDVVQATKGKKRRGRPPKKK
tara:strand:- start:638 stop:889 length:252 start_codon:yes stop_codon:yes gene_type:complete